MYMCVCAKDVDFVSVSTLFLIKFWNSSDIVVYFTLPTLWYILLFRHCGIFYSSDIVVYFFFILFHYLLLLTGILLHIAIATQNS
jgi:hypothetical protein